eukprot:COSAG01_NODE_1319_length_10746_cov_23.542125_3_plen_130_part_00
MIIMTRRGYVASSFAALRLVGTTERTLGRRSRMSPRVSRMPPPPPSPPPEPKIGVSIATEAGRGDSRTVSASALGRRTVARSRHFSLRIGENPVDATTRREGGQRSGAGGGTLTGPRRRRACPDHRRAR